jgi:hypothetical protein
MRLPCINCLIFPICRERYRNVKLTKNHVDLKGSFELFDRRNAVVSKCSISEDYFRKKLWDANLKKAVDEFHKLFRVEGKHE